MFLVSSCLAGLKCRYNGTNSLYSALLKREGFEVLSENELYDLLNSF